MGIRRHSLEFIHKNINELGSNLEILDMGNTYIKGQGCIDYINKNYSISNDTTLDGFNRVNGNIISKEYFTALGHTHTSIDLNGKEGALTVDLRNPVEEMVPELINKFDVIMDIGTSEHVEYQYMNFKNLYDMLKVGGQFVHILPLEGTWMAHCKYKYNFDFFKLLAEANNYKILDLYVEKTSADNTDVCCSMKKTSDGNFMSESDFDNLPLVIEGGENFNDRVLYGYAYSGNKYGK